ncbi:MAG: ABC transporter permease [Anaerolineaceae bacterium]|nr:ABC transporter permease [Anaerolineaceae bacterium]
MIRKFTNMIAQDFLLTFRSGHIYVILAMAAIILILVFALPVEINTDAQEYFYDASEAGIFGQYLVTLGAEPDMLLASEADLNSTLAESQRALGVIFRGSLTDPEFEIIVQGNISQENINLLEKTLDTIIQSLQGTYQPTEAELTILNENSEPIPLNKNMIPIFMSFEVILLGFLIGAVLIFQSKQEGTIRAYRVSPGGTLIFILSKVLLYDVISLIYGLVVSLIAFGTAPNYLQLSLLIIGASTLLTLVGLAIAVFFTNISEWFFAGATLLIVAMLPMLSYAMPVFSPAFITWIPTYEIIFGFRNVLFEMGSAAALNQTFLILGVSVLVSFAICYLAVDKRLMKAGL